jgi:pyruvate carboxylase subunit B
VKILVLEGQTVEEGQGLLILEAMKMENQVKAPVAGVVARIHVREGDSVESDALLVEIEELPSA